MMRTAQAPRRVARLVRHLVCAVGLLAALATPAAAVEVDVVIGVHGATFMPWDAMDQTGNGYGVTAGVNLDDFRLMAGLGAILPASLTEGRFAALWLETQWHPLRGVFAEWGVPLSPYLLAGLGVGLPDDFASAPSDAPPGAVRWVTDDPQVMGIGGLGVAVGAFDGFFVGADVRVYNATYGGFLVSAGYAF